MFLHSSLALSVPSRIDCYIQHHIRKDSGRFSFLFIFFVAKTEKCNDLAAESFPGGKIDEKVESVIEILEASKGQDKIAVEMRDHAQTDEKKEERIGQVADEIGKRQGEQRTGRLHELIATLHVLLAAARRVYQAASRDRHAATTVQVGVQAASVRQRRCRRLVVVLVDWRAKHVDVTYIIDEYEIDDERDDAWKRVADDAQSEIDVHFDVLVLIVPFIANSAMSVGYVSVLICGR